MQPEAKSPFTHRHLTIPLLDRAMWVRPGVPDTSCREWGEVEPYLGWWSRQLYERDAQVHTQDCSWGTRRLRIVQAVDDQRRRHWTGLRESEKGTKVTASRESGKVQAGNRGLEVFIERGEPLDNGDVRDDGV